MQGVDDAVELGVHGLSIGLVVDRVQQRLDPRPVGLRGRGHQVGRVVGPAALPTGARARGRDRSYEPGVGVRGDELDPREAAGGQIPKASQPAPSSLVVT